MMISHDIIGMEIQNEWPHHSQNDIAAELEVRIWEREHRRRKMILLSRQAQVGVDAGNFGVSDIAYDLVRDDVISGARHIPRSRNART
jgi:hypothetical protein